MNTVTMAATRRAMLANAHADFMSTRDRDEADVALEATLVATQMIDEEDIVDTIHRQGTTIVITVLKEDGTVQGIELDAYGNTLVGEV